MKLMRVAIYTFIILIITVSITTKVTRAAQPAIQVSTVFDTLAEDGVCSLREAILSANLDQPVGGCSAGDGVDQIYVPAGIYELAIPGPGEDAGLTGDLDIAQSVTIYGVGIDNTILDGGSMDRILHVTSEDARVFVNNLTIENGNVDPTDLLGGGGILSLGTITLDQVALRHNSALRGGGARNSQGQMTILNSIIEENTAWLEGGGVYGDGLMVISSTTLHSNQAEIGGGISSDEATTLTDVTFSQNVASSYGGGLFNDAIATFQRVLFRANHAPNGAGLFNNHLASLSNVTFSENISQRSSAFVGRGGAIFNTGQATLLNSTLAGNSAEQGGNLFNAEGGTITLQMSILAASEGGNCINLDQVISNGYNISDDSLCDLNAIGDRMNTDPRLAPLADNLGSTLSHALLLNSPAIDYGPRENCPATDQRGVMRPIDGNRDGIAGCDIGAFEHAPGGIVYFDPAEQSTAEQTQEIMLWVKRFGGDGRISVDYEGRMGTANLGSDFELNPGTLSWGSLDHSANQIALSILDDDYREEDEIGLVHLLNPAGQAGLLLPLDRFALVILSNDPEGPPQPGGPIYLPLIIRSIQR